VGGFAVSGAGQQEGPPWRAEQAAGEGFGRLVYDLNSALVARSKLKELTEVIWQTRPESISILAHSMGTFLTMEGLVDAQLSGRLGRSGRIDNIILASPDIDIDLFKTQVGILPENIREKIFLLVSKDDAALRLSRRIAGGVPRAGAANADELEGLGVTVIDLSQIEDSASGSHSKFAGSPEVVQLIGQGLESAGTFDKGLRTDLGDILRGVPISIFGD
jgi:esterase/lipase superfamily enzyme